MEIKLYFTQHEMEEILVDHGYTLAYVPVWEVEDLDGVYGLDSKDSLRVAYKGEAPQPGEYQVVRFKYGVEEVFKKFYKERIKSLLF